MDCSELEIDRGTNPDIIFEFFMGDDPATSPRLDLTGATLNATSNIPGFSPLTPIAIDLVQGMVYVPLTEAMTNAMKRITTSPYFMTVRAVDVDAKIHKATVTFKVQ